jgi:RNA polymerase sigma factor (TIGR02999 family)
VPSLYSTFVTGSEDDITRLLDSAAEGDTDAAARLLPLVYDQLRGAAAREMADERDDHTLQATALVHEAYLRLVGDRRVPWAGRAHFYVAAAEAMRRILLDHAKARGRLKRGGGRPVLTLEPGCVGDLAAAADPEIVVAFDEAFRRLEDESPDAASVMRLRFYGGLSVQDTAAALGIAPRTVSRHWAFARAFMYAALQDTCDEP